MRISRIIATRLIQEAIRHVWAAGDAVEYMAAHNAVEGVSMAQAEIGNAKNALLALIDLVGAPAVDLPSITVERKIREAVYDMLDRAANLLDVPKPRPRRRK